MHHRATLAIAVFATSLITACGGPPNTAPVHQGPLLPDLVAAPSVDLSTSHQDDGTVLLRFSSVLVNIGDGDFLLRAVRQSGVWTVHQVISDSDDDGEMVETQAELVWGGDGHDHWHIARVAHHWLVALDDEGSPLDDFRSRADTKVGFCFFDHIRELAHGPTEATFSVHDCGHEDDVDIQMGMSPGWSDKYLWNLPGQQIDITDLDDGTYRLWAEVDPDRHFVEATSANNRTWIDLELLTLENGRRGALVASTGPSPTDHRD